MSKKLKIETELKDDLTIIKIDGYLDAHTAPSLENKIEEIINSNNFRIIVNFSNLEYISSAGLGVFMSQIENLRNNNGDLKLTAMKSKVYSVFDLLGFPMLFNITKTQDEAIQNFYKNAEKDG